MTLSPERNARRARAIAAIAATYAVIAAFISFLGWPLGRPALTEWDGTGYGIAIQPNTCVLMVLAGVGIILRQFQRQRAVVALGSIVLTVGALNILQHLTRHDFGFNHPLMFGHQWGQSVTIAPGLMGPPASISFTLLGAALIMLGRSTRREPLCGPSRKCASSLGLAVGTLMLFSLIGYLFAAREFYAIPWLSAIALQTSSMFAAMSIAVIASVPEHQPMRLLLSDSNAGMMARRTLPLLIVVPPFLGMLRIFGADLGWYDEGTGRALLIVGIILVTVALMWNTLRVVARHEEAEDAKTRYIEETLESLADGFIRLDSDWRFTYVNREAERIIMERGALLGRHWHDVFPEAVGTEMERIMQRVVREHVTIEMENYYQPWKRWFLLKMYPTEDGGLTSIFTDITAQKQMQETIHRSEVHLAEELSRRTDQVIRAERALARNERMAAVGTLASGLAHDINNIAMPLGLRMERLLRTRGLAPEIKNELSAVTALLEHLRSMARNLSLFSRDPEQEGIVGYTDLATWWGSVEMLLASSLFGPKADTGSVRLVGDIPVKLPPVKVSPHRLTQAVINLVHNARDAIMARGTDCETNGDGPGARGTITIQARVSPNEPAVSLKVIDDGCGMAPEVMARALEPFFTTKDRSGGSGASGSGLGLSLVQAICERSGGSLEIESEVGLGTTITMVLPIASDTEEAVAAEQSIS